MRKTAAKCLCLIVTLCILAACSRTNNPYARLLPEGIPLPSSSSQAALPSSSSQERRTSNPQNTQSSSQVQSQSSSSGLPQWPDGMPPIETFIPEGVVDTEAFNPQTEGRVRQFSALRTEHLLTTFDGFAYKLVNYNYRRHIRAALYSEHDLFFVFKKNLYYSDLSNIYLVMKDVKEIAGSDKDGMYLIVRDDEIPDFPAGEWDFNPKNSLVHYHPVTGTVTPILKNVYSAFVTGEDKDVLFYASAEPENNRLGHRFVIKMRNLVNSSENLLFYDEYILSDIGGDDLVDAAHSVFFNEESGGVRAGLMYPYPSEFPYERYVLFAQDGSILVDSEKEKYIMNLGPQEYGVFHNRYIYTTGTVVNYYGPYRLTAEYYTNESGIPYHNYLIEYNGENINWMWRTRADMVYRNGLLYSAQEPLSSNDTSMAIDNYNINVYDGKYTYPIDIDAYDMFVYGNNLYFLSSRTYDDGAQTLMVSRAVGNGDNPTSVQFLFALDSDETLDYFYTNEPTKVAGKFLIMCPSEGDDIIVYNMENGHMATAGGERTTLYVN